MEILNLNVRWLAYGFVGFVVIMTLAFSILSEKRRRKAMLNFAGQRGWSFSPRGDVSILPKSMNLFTFGHTRSISNLMTGKRQGISWSVFDYYAVSGYGKHKTTIYDTVIMAKSKKLNLPQFLISPENWLNRLGDLFGVQDIDFEMYPEFSKRYRLKGPDEAAIRKVFNTQVISALNLENNLLQVEGVRDTIIFYHARRRFKIRALDKRIRQVKQVIDAFPKKSD